MSYQLGTGPEVVKPDLVLPPGDNVDPTGLNPCPACDSYAHQAPEGVHDVHSVFHNPGVAIGDAKWSFPHCWKCGFRPGTNVAVAQNELVRQFEHFKEWYAEHAADVYGHPTLQAPGNNAAYDAEIAELRRQIEELREGK